MTLIFILRFLCGTHHMPIWNMHSIKKIVFNENKSGNILTLVKTSLLWMHLQRKTLHQNHVPGMWEVLGWLRPLGEPCFDHGNILKPQCRWGVPLCWKHTHVNGSGSSGCDLWSLHCHEENCPHQKVSISTWSFLPRKMIPSCLGVHVLLYFLPGKRKKNAGNVKRCYLVSWLKKTRTYHPLLTQYHAFV